MKVLNRQSSQSFNIRKLNHNNEEAEPIITKPSVDIENFLTQENKAKVIQTSSFIKGCHPSNLLNSDSNVTLYSLLSFIQSLWMSETTLPQSVIFDISCLKKKAKFYQCFGFQCSHAYSSNPSLIDLFLSKDGIQFKHWATINPVFREGKQLFAIDPIGPSYKYLEIIIKETYGANRTYLNQIFLIEKHPKFQSQKENIQKNHTPTKAKNESYSPYRSSSIEQQMRNYLQEKQLAKNMPSEIQKKQFNSSSATKKTEEGFASQDYFSLQSQYAKPTPNFNQQNAVDPQQYCQMLGSLQVNFNHLCDKLKDLQGEFESVQSEFQQSISSPHKEVSTPYIHSPQRNNLSSMQQTHNLNSQSRHQTHSYNHFNSIHTQSVVTPRDDLKQEIMGECLTFCQNQIHQLASQRSKKPLDKQTDEQQFLETKLQSIIEDWQRKFFTEYIQPTMQNQYEQMEQKIILSIEKKASQSIYFPNSRPHEEIGEFQVEQQQVSLHESQLDEESSQEYQGATEQMFEQIAPMSPSSAQDDYEVGNNAQKEIKKIAEVLQQKLAIKAAKLKQLQQEQLESDINDEIRSQIEDYI